MTANQRIVLLAANDAVLAPLAVASAGYLTSVDAAGPSSFKLLVVCLVLVSTSFVIELGKPPDMGLKGVTAKTIMSFCLSLCIFSSLHYSFNFFSTGRESLTISILIFWVLQFATHAGLRICENLEGFASRVLILGSGPLAGHLGTLIRSSENNFVLAGYVKCLNEQEQVPAELLLNGSPNLCSVAKREKTDKIVVSLSERRGVFPLRDVMECKLSGIEVIDASSFYERLAGKLLLESITPSWFIFSEGFKIAQRRRISKRVLDLACSTIGILLTLPMLPLIALVVKLDSAGPVFFRQERVGQGEKLFTLYKFRTMRSDAEKETGAVWALEHDPRITRVGNFLRKTRLDELPQLYNVLRGDMSLVGPRPERLEFVEKLKEIIPYYSERHLTKPGVTGWAQVRYPYGASAGDAIEKLRYDLYYIKNLSIFFDLVILFDTIGVVLFRRGSR